MSVKGSVIDGGGSGREARVMPDGALLVVQPTAPPLLTQDVRVFRQYLTDDGTSTAVGLANSNTPHSRV